MDGPLGNAAINDVDLRVAASLGKRDRSAASCQGSTPKRANADRTLSCMPLLLFPPIVAVRKPSNSGLKVKAEAGRATSSPNAMTAIERQGQAAARVALGAVHATHRG
ncbi:MAG: hypothetical protein ABI440_14570 [Casimicrobiaceae bacterium]